MLSLIIWLKHQHCFSIQQLSKILFHVFSIPCGLFCNYVNTFITGVCKSTYFDFLLPFLAYINLRLKKWCLGALVVMFFCLVKVQKCGLTLSSTNIRFCNENPNTFLQFRGCLKHVWSIEVGPGSCSGGCEFVQC